MPWVGVALMWIFASALEDGIGFAHASAIALLVGLLLGVLWYRLYPRPLARRLVPLFAVISVVVLVSGAVGDFASQPPGSVLVTVFGIAAGLAFTEVLAPKRTSLDSDHLARAAGPR